MKIGLIVDRAQVARWQADALQQIVGEHEFVLYNCTSVPPARRNIRHAFYYLLNLVSVRNKMTRRAELPAGLRIAAVRNFEALISGTWQELPDQLVDQMGGDSAAVIVKFGMGLLRVPPADRLSAPIISYHHGDSTRYRGRPAGFYELLHGESTLGQVVQILSNSLDAGAVVASAETRVIAHSYKATLIEAYRHSALLLKPAIDNAAHGMATPPATVGRNYRLPGNRTVLRLAVKCLLARVKWLIYGAFYEKRWMVASSPAILNADCPVPVPAERAAWIKVPLPAGYRFIADPFPHPHGGTLVEALRSSTDLGEIVHIQPASAQPLCAGAGHYSYPATFRFAGEDYLLPEVSEWSPPLLYRFGANGLTQLGELRVAGSPRLVDPTVHLTDSALFLFANVAREAGSVLRLWTAADPSDEFVEHPRSPIRISPAGARMGGMILDHHGQPYRVGQDSRGAYGDGVLLFRTDILTLDEYRETPVAELHFSGCQGPHTLNVTRDGLLFDYYFDRFSLFAGVRRLRSILHRRLSDVRRGRSGTAPNIRHVPHN